MYENTYGLCHLSRIHLVCIPPPPAQSLHGRIAFSRAAHMVARERSHVAFGGLNSLALPTSALRVGSRHPRARSTVLRVDVSASGSFGPRSRTSSLEIFQHHPPRRRSQTLGPNSATTANAPIPTIAALRRRPLTSPRGERDRARTGATRVSSSP
ncbi:hypothetical protein BC628DRAFT_131147 [Trametes gibbosa]|nr:hypothetical protein BC628DRAFT_131147 [Trametes gibbosa]